MIGMRKYKIILITLLMIFSASAAGAAVQDYKAEALKHYNRGKVFYQQGMFKEAEEEFQKAKQLIDEGKAEKAKAAAASQQKQPAVSPQINETAPAAPVPEAVTRPKIKRRADTYTISEGDVLDVRVWQNDDLNGELTVRPDGMVSFPLVGDIQAEDLTVPEFSHDLVAALKEYIRNPQVSVSIKQIAGKKIIVLGQVKTPGVYAVTGKRTILEAVGMAGGFTQHAVIKSVILVRGGLADPKPQRLNLIKSLRNGDMKENVVLQSGDIVYVPKKYLANLNYYVGLILDPLSRGVFTVREYRGL